MKLKQKIVIWVFRNMSTFPKYLKVEMNYRGCLKIIARVA